MLTFVIYGKAQADAPLDAARIIAAGDYTKESDMVLATTVLLAQGAKIHAQVTIPGNPERALIGILQARYTAGGN